MTSSAARFNAEKCSQALETIRRCATLHEGLYEALTDNLQWLESLSALADSADPDLARLLQIAAEPAIARVEDRILAAVQALSPAHIERIVTQLDQLTEKLSQD